jgi:hypothetical protein
MVSATLSGQPGFAVVRRSVLPSSFQVYELEMIL